MDTTLQQIANALALGSLYALIALGYTMIYGILRLINFAHGDVFMLGAFAGAYTARALNPSVAGAATPEQSVLQAFVGILVAMTVCATIGYLIERVAYRPLRRSPRLSSLITAIGVSLLIEYLAQIEWRIPGFALHVGSRHWQFAGASFFGSTPQTYQGIHHSDEPIGWIRGMLGVSIVPKDALVLGTTLATMVALYFIVQHTRVGRAMRAVALNHDAARLMGIDLDRIISFTFVLGSALAAVGGCLWGLRYNQVSPLIGLTVGLKAFVAAVIGGIGNIPGAALGGLILAAAETLVSALGYSQYQDGIAFVILILVLLVRPEGIFGKFVPEKV